jgi:hypothetical protein
VTDQTRIAIVTGSARGLEGTIAKRLGTDGFAVAVLDLEETAGKSVVDQVKTCRGEALVVGADVTQGHAVQITEGKVTEELGAPNVLVNNAGITGDNMLFTMTTVVGCRYERSPARLVPDEQGHPEVPGRSHVGQIVNLSSVSALGNRGQANCAAAKAGIQGFTKTLAIELGKFRGHGERHRTRSHRDRDDRQHRQAHGGAVRGLHGCRSEGGPCGPPGTARGHRREGVVLRPRVPIVRVRSGHLRHRRPPRLSRGHRAGAQPHEGDTNMKTFNGLDAFEQAVGTHLGYSDWHTITQEQINLFAEAAGDHQWIHTDPDRAATGPFGTAIAHGYLTLSLVPTLAWQIYTVESSRMGASYRCNRVRLPSQIPVGPESGPASNCSTSSEIRGAPWEGGEKPACVAEPVSVLVN